MRRAKAAVIEIKIPQEGRMLQEGQPAGKVIPSGRRALRGSIAINYYRLAHAAGAGAPSAAAEVPMGAAE
jgi:hypothetical protein